MFNNVERRNFLRAALGLGACAGLRAQQGNQQGRADRIDLPRNFNEHTRQLAAAHGNRFTKPGSERMTVLGTVVSGRASTGVKLTYELPGKLRFEETGGRGNQIVTNQGPAQGRVGINDDEDDLMEALLHDSAEYFFSNANERNALRHLGNRFRTTSGSFVDIYQSAVQITARRDLARRVKFYQFDSTTGLFAGVRTNIVDAATTTQIDTEWTGWRQVNGQMAPGRVRRLENRQEKLNISFGAVNFSPAAADGFFERP